MKVKTSITNRLIILACMLVIIASAITSLPWSEAKQQVAEEAHRKRLEALNPFKEVTVVAESALVMNASTGEVIYRKNETELMPLASITKVMTALVASEINQPDTLVTVNYEALKEGSNAGLGPSRWTFDNILDYSLVTSSNGAAKAIAMTSESISGKDFIKQMNDKAKQIGLLDTYFINPTGLDVGGPHGGSYGTAFDIAKLFQYVLKYQPDLLEATRYPTIQTNDTAGYSYTGYNTNQTVDQIPGILGSKTGFTDNAGGNLAIAFDAGLDEPYVVVVLGSTKESRFTDIKTLVDTTTKYKELMKN